jgi:hypothetical protein
MNIGDLPGAAEILKLSELLSSLELLSVQRTFEL